jgi:hypothetical protein
VQYPCDTPLVLEGSTEPQCYIDPSIQVNQSQQAGPIEGDPAVELGFYVEQLYQALDAEASCPVVHGLQGGTWTMPAIRTIGIGSPATVDCMFVTDVGEELGAVKAKSKFFLSPDGYLEVQGFPVPVRPDTDAPINDLYGLGATLSCSVTDAEGRGSQASIHVTITEG